MRRDRSGAVVLVAALLAPPLASAGALEHCTRLAPTRLEVTACLEAGRKAMTDAMLEQFLAVEKSLVELEKVTGRGGKVAALKQSQRDFERYMGAHCQLAPLAAAAPGNLAPLLLACEAETLWDRAAQLRRLLPPKKD